MATALPDLLGVYCGTLAQARIEHASTGLRWATATVAFFQANASSDVAWWRAVTRVYGPETWEVYDLLDRSLDPRGPDAMLALGIDRLTPASRVLDVGCRDASYLIELMRATGATGVGLDPVTRLVEQARRAVGEAGLNERIEIVKGVMQHIPFSDGSFHLVCCRDVIEVVEALAAGIAEIARVLRPGGHLIAFTVLTTDRLEPKESQMLLARMRPRYSHRAA